MTAKKLRRLDPLVMLLDGLFTFGSVGITEVAFAIDHDQDTFHTVVITSFLQVTKVGLVASFVLKELVDVFNCFDSEFFASDAWKIEVGDLVASSRSDLCSDHSASEIL